MHTISGRFRVVSRNGFFPLGQVVHIDSGSALGFYEDESYAQSACHSQILLQVLRAERLTKKQLMPVRVKPNGERLWVTGELFLTMRAAGVPLQIMARERRTGLSLRVDVALFRSRAFFRRFANVDRGSKPEAVLR
jgi:hypothetical protein